jgi:hypothetical protein
MLKGGPVADHLLLMFAWPLGVEDCAVTLVVASFPELAWLSKDDPNPLQPSLVHVWINMAAADREVPFVFLM